MSDSTEKYSATYAKTLSLFCGCFYHNDVYHEYFGSKSIKYRNKGVLSSFILVGSKCDVDGVRVHWFLPVDNGFKNSLIYLFEGENFDIDEEILKKISKYL